MAEEFQKPASLYDSTRERSGSDVFDKDNKADREKKAYDLLCKVGLKEKVNSYPSQMSGGEQQRVAIAIALANDPKILLADEPTGAVDSKTSDMIQDLFRKLNEELGITVIIVTHDISLANKVSRVVMIADGKISTEKIMKEDYRKELMTWKALISTDQILMRNIQFWIKRIVFRSVMIFWRQQELTQIK